MRMIKRWTTGLFSRVDWMVSQVENQEALVGSALRQAREATARSKVQLGRVFRDGERLRERLHREEEAIGRWRERAGALASEDEETAMECLRRSKRAQETAAQLRQRLAEHERTEQELAREVRAMEEELSTLTEKRNLMRTRQSRAEAAYRLQEGSDTMGCELDEVFERWETRITERELGAGCSSTADSLEQSFLSTEEEAELRAELRQLTRDD